MQSKTVVRILRIYQIKKHEFLRFLAAAHVFWLFFLEHLTLDTTWYNK